MNAKQARFVAEYLVDLNATAAAKRAGYKEKSAADVGRRLVRKSPVKEAIAAKTEAQLQQAEITAQDVVNELAAIARSRAWYLDERGNLLPPEKLSPDAAAALEGWDVVRRNVASGDGHTDEVIRIRGWNKVEALKLLAQRFGLLDERAQLGGRIEIACKDSLVERLHEGRKRVAEPASRQDPDDAP